METNNFVTEQNVSIHDFERVCRTCLSTIDLVSISNLLDTGYFPVEIALNKYTQVQFDPLDKLPKQICSDCVKNLKNSYSFLLNCDLVNASLKKCLARHESNLPTNIYLPKEIEYVNCQIKQEPAEFDLSEFECNDKQVTPSKTKIENLHTAVDIKEEPVDNSEDENYSDNYDGEQMANVTLNRRKIFKRKPDLHIDSSNKMDNDEEFFSTPPEIEQAAKNACLGLLPAKSMHIYEVVYGRFKEWCVSKKVKSATENVLLAYFSQRSTQIKPNSLWSEYSMIKSCMLLKEDVQIKKFDKLTAFLKRQSIGYKPKKSNILSRDQINTFLKEAPNLKYLMMKVALIFGITGACTREELKNMSLNDITCKKDIIIVKIPQTKNNKERTFVVKNNDENINIVKLIKEYSTLRPTNASHSRFFIQYRKGKCGVQPIGINTFGAIPSIIATFLKLEDAGSYTGHTFRRSSATLLANERGDIRSLKKHELKHSTETEDSLESKIKIAKITQ